MALVPVIAMAAAATAAVKLTQSKYYDPLYVFSAQQKRLSDRRAAFVIYMIWNPLSQFDSAKAGRFLLFIRRKF